MEVHATDPRYDWQAIELDYRAGVLPLGVISSKHGCPVSTIHNSARRFGWLRSPPPDLPYRATQAAAIITIPDRHTSSASRIGDSQWSDADVQRTATLAAASVVSHHQFTLAKARQLTDKVMLGLATELAGQVPDFAYRRPSESPLDALEKLTKVMVRLVGLERQAYGLDVLTEAPDDDATVQDTVSDMMDKLDQIAATKRNADTPPSK